MYLYINATDPRSPIEIRLWDGAVWQSFSIERQTSRGPLLALDTFLKERHKTIYNVRALFVFMGQGSFTATRSIATIANSLALSTTMPVIAVSVPPTENPELLIPATSSVRYILPRYSAPARIGPSVAKPAQI